MKDRNVKWRGKASGFSISSEYFSIFTAFRHDFIPVLVSPLSPALGSLMKDDSGKFDMLITPKITSRFKSSVGEIRQNSMFCPISPKSWFAFYSKANQPKEVETVGLFERSFFMFYFAPTMIFWSILYKMDSIIHFFHFQYQFWCLTFSICQHHSDTEKLKCWMDLKHFCF